MTHAEMTHAEMTHAEMTHTDATHDLPPAPNAQSISPAPEDYAGRPAAGALVWPVLWLAALVALACVLSAHGFSGAH